MFFVRVGTLQLVVLELQLVKCESMGVILWVYEVAVLELQLVKRESIGVILVILVRLSVCVRGVRCPGPGRVTGFGNSENDGQ